MSGLNAGECLLRFVRGCLRGLQLALGEYCFGLRSVECLPGGGHRLRRAWKGIRRRQRLVSVSLGDFYPTRQRCEPRLFLEHLLDFAGGPLGKDRQSVLGNEECSGEGPPSEPAELGYLLGEFRWGDLRLPFPVDEQLGVSDFGEPSCGGFLAQPSNSTKYGTTKCELHSRF